MSEDEKEVLKIMYEEYSKSGNDSVTMTLYSKPALKLLEDRGLVKNEPEMQIGIISTLTATGKEVAKNL